MHILLLAYTFGAVVTTLLIILVMRKLFPKTYPLWKCLAMGLIWPVTWSFAVLRD